PSGRIGRVPTIFSSSFSEVDAMADLLSRYFHLDITSMHQRRQPCNACHRLQSKGTAAITRAT
ncbi:MAG TPA: hypothetical protein VN900_01665, partial [Stellaceae bacterium]|nr:hypothetical protein [Stellaceae bacterium]